MNEVTSEAKSNSLPKDGGSTTGISEEKTALAKAVMLESSTMDSEKKIIVKRIVNIHSHRFRKCLLKENIFSLASSGQI